MTTLIESTELIRLEHAEPDPKRKDTIRRFELPDGPDAPLQITLEARSTNMPGIPGSACSIFFNIEYEQGPVFWDTFCYPDTGSTPWQPHSCHMLARGPVRCVEMHVRLHGTGTLEVRNVKVQAIDPIENNADVTIAVFGDSTDQTVYIPTDLRLTRRLELLLRDRFSDRLIDVHCMAEGGEFLQRLLETDRLERELRALSKCDIAMVRYGLNDAPKDIKPKDFEAQLETACDTIHRIHPNATIVLSTTIPALGDPYAQPTIDVANRRGLSLIRIDEMMRTRSAAGDSDWHNSPTSMIGRRRTENPTDNPDGLQGDLHPNAYGSQMIAEAYMAHLELIVENLLRDHGGRLINE